MSEQEQVHICETEGCQSTETQEYFYPFDDNTEWLCYEHAKEGGFCLWCNYFGAGLESFDFGGHPGYHAECYRDIQYESGELPDDDDLDFGWDEYPHGWHDPDVDSSMEDSTHTYIGEDREDLG